MHPLPFLTYETLSLIIVLPWQRGQEMRLTDLCACIRVPIEEISLFLYSWWISHFFVFSKRRWVVEVHLVLSS